jgi:hypothetical protein
VRVLATFQLMVSVLGFFAFLFALNYGGAAANLGVLPLMFVYFLYGFVSALFLYSTLTFTRILALVWYAVFLIPVGLARISDSVLSFRARFTVSGSYINSAVQEESQVHTPETDLIVLSALSSPDLF